MKINVYFVVCGLNVFESSLFGNDVWIENIPSEIVSEASMSAVAVATASAASRLSIFSGIFYPAKNTECVMGNGVLCSVCSDLFLGAPVTYEHLGILGALSSGEGKIEDGFQRAGELYAPAGVLGRTIAG